MEKELAGLFVLAAPAVSMLSGCTDPGAANSAQATAENPMVLNLAHSLTESHTTSIAFQQFADEVNEKSRGYLQVRMSPNDMLGSKTEVPEQLMAGVVDMTHASTPGLTTYDEGCYAFGLPYIFGDNENYYEAMGSDAIGEFFRSSEADGFMTLIHYTSGSRSFYTIDKPIRKPEGLKGLKVRVQNMKSQTDMMKALRGTPVTMTADNVCTALQTGIIGGSENNGIVLITGMHGEICKYFSIDQHTMIPDVLMIATDTWNSLPEKDRQILLDVVRNFMDNHILEWEAAVNDVLETAKARIGVTIVESVGKEAFRQVTAGVVGEYRRQYPKMGAVLDIIDSIEQEGDYKAVSYRV